MATNTILGIFDDPQAARRAVETLRDGSIDLEDVSIVSRATETGAPVSSADDVSAGEGAAVGAVWGGLVGLASLLIPGIGPFIAFGALGAALTGAVTGAVVGGIAAALIDFGDVSEDEARAYEAQVHAGKTLVAVKAREEHARAVRQVLASAGAESIRDNQTDMTTGASSAINVSSTDASGEAVNTAREFGAPANPTTQPRDVHDTPGVDMPRIDRTPNLFEPRVEPRPTIDEPVATGRADQLEPRRSGDYVSTDQTPQITTPESLGVAPSTAPDTNLGEEDESARRTI